MELQGASTWSYLLGFRDCRGSGRHDPLTSSTPARALGSGCEFRRFLSPSSVESQAQPDWGLDPPPGPSGQALHLNTLKKLPCTNLFLQLAVLADSETNFCNCLKKSTNTVQPGHLIFGVTRQSRTIPTKFEGRAARDAEAAVVSNLGADAASAVHRSL